MNIEKTISVLSNRGGIIMKIRRKVLWCLLIVLAAIVTQSIVFAATPEILSTASDGTVAEELSIVSDGKASYTLIIQTNAPTKVNSAAHKVRNAIKSATGVDISMQNDGRSAVAAEILVGETNREESKALMQATPYGEYAIRVINGKIVIAAWDDTAITKACETFAAYVKEQGKKGELTVSADYSDEGVVTKGFGAIPHYGNTKTKVQFIDLADNSYMLYVPSASEKAFSDYLESLTEQGFTEFSRRKAGNRMTYATYTSEETILHISFNSTTREVRIAADEAYDMSIFTGSEYEKVCEPAVALVGQEVEVSSGWIYNALCMVFRLEDGRFIVVDSGYSTFSVNKLYKTLRSLHVNEGKITIAAWIFTHPHSDHTGGFTTLSSTSIKRRIVVENFIHHFASNAQHDYFGSYGTAKNVRTVMNGYRKANIIKAHSGQVFKLGGLEIEMLYTYADLEPEMLDEMNTTSLVFRVTAQDNTIMVLGDASNRSINYLIDTYGYYLDSDMVQIAHHGYNGVADLYTLIDADVVLFPGGVNQFYGRRNLYRLMDWEFNKRALDLAEECYVAGDSIHVLILPYTPKDNRSVRIYDGE